ncbi:MAG: glycosyltransferase family 4 protein [Thermoguttaceae bacterium]|nr:glycosyltransferase family 4 protein [Thermoguttaceae bacterium]MDW8077889.1 glycosyltransferase family 4 protein [Thermoguttaceae bacterium]
MAEVLTTGACRFWPPERLRVALVAAGSGADYCGSCFHSAELARSLQAVGVEAVIVPTYLPLDPASDCLPQTRVFFGGVSVFLEQVIPLFRYTPAWLDRLWEGRWLLRLLGRLSGVTRPEKLGPLTVSMLAGQEGHQRKEIDKLVDFLRTELRPHVVHLSTGLLAGVGEEIARQLNVPVVCTMAGEDQFLDRLSEPYRARAYTLIRQKLEAISAVVALSRYYGARCIDRFGLKREKVTVIPPGVSTPNKVPRQASADNGRDGLPVRIGFLGRLCPEKGIGILSDAVAQLAESLSTSFFEIRLAGRIRRDYRSAWQRKVKGLSRQGVNMTYLGPLSPQEKEEFFATVDLMVLPSLVPEPKAVTAIESVARGIPVIAPAEGALLEIVGQTGIGELYWPNTAERLAGVLERWIKDFVHKPATDRYTMGLRPSGYYQAERMARQTVALYGRLLWPVE